jgi:hypothetical protein
MPDRPTKAAISEADQNGKESGAWGWTAGFP